MAYRPGQGIATGTADKLRLRSELAEVCEVCGERAEDGGLNCASVDDAKQWKGLLGEGGGNRKKARCSECTKPLPEDHDPALGPFCAKCAPPPEQRKAASHVPIPAKVDAAELASTEFGHLVRPGICKSCKEERRIKEKEEAKGKKDIREQAREQALEDGLEPPERIAVSLGERPFGMTPSKAEGVGYLVAKVSDGKPAAKAGIRPGWCVVEIAGQSCKGLDLDATQALLKPAALPVDLVFEALPGGGDFCTTCQRVLVWALFSRKMRTKPPEKRRCTACVEASGAE